MRIAPLRFVIRIALVRAGAPASLEGVLIDETGAVFIDDQGFALVVV